MNNVIIKRCPVCPTIRSHTQQIVKALADDFGMKVRVEDGVKGEFAVYAGGVPVLQRNGDTLPSPDEVEAAVGNAIPAGV
jgi:hypothetical protein